MTNISSTTLSRRHRVASLVAINLLICIVLLGIFFSNKAYSLTTLFCGGHAESISIEQQAEPSSVEKNKIAHGDFKAIYNATSIDYTEIREALEICASTPEAEVPNEMIENHQHCIKELATQLEKEEKYLRAFIMYKRSNSYFHMARFYEKGLGVTQDMQSARNFYEKFFKESGDSNRLAISKLIIYYANGIGGDKNLPKALALANYAKQTRYITPTVQNILDNTTSKLISKMSTQQQKYASEIYKDLLSNNPPRKGENTSPAPQGVISVPASPLYDKAKVFMENIDLEHSKPKSCHDDELDSVWWFEPLRKSRY